MTSTRGRSPRIFVTVGSTKFVGLIEAVLSKDFVHAIASTTAPNTASLVVQYGATPLADILTADTSAVLQGKDADDSFLAAGGVDVSLLGGPSNIAKGDEDDVEDYLSKEGLAKTFKPVRSDDGDDSESDQDPRAGRALRFRIPCPASKNSVLVELVDYMTSITPYLQSSHVVISHAGSGTILETLRIDGDTKPTLVVVPNETLMDNHQTELALALSKKNYVIATRIGGSQNRLPALISVLLSDSSPHKPNLSPFPAMVPGRFRSMVDAELGFY